MYNEFECHKCKHDLHGNYEKFFNEFTKEENYHEGFAAHNCVMISLEEYADEDGECDKYIVEITCPNCGTKKTQQDWSK